MVSCCCNLQIAKTENKKWDIEFLGLVEREDQ